MTENNEAAKTLWDLKADLDKQKEIDNEAINEFKKSQMTLTDSEMEAVKKFTEERVVAVQETSPDGMVSTTPIKDYAASLDERVTEVKSMVGAISDNKIVKLLNNGDIKRDIKQMKDEAKKKTLAAFRSMAVDSELTDDEYMDINDAAIYALQEHFNVERLDSEAITKKLSKMPLKKVAEIFPAKFIDIYLTPEELATNDIAARERFITTVAYLTAAGPEMDYLNEYIDNENKLIMVTTRLMQCHASLSEIIQSDEKLSELVAKSQEIEPLDTSFWSKYIEGGPNKVHNEFAQRAAIQAEYKKAYEAVLEDYPLLDESDPDYDARLKERELILNEVNECQNKYNIYVSVTKMELLDKLWMNIQSRILSNRRTDFAFLNKMAIDALDRIRKSKQNVSFPIYDPALAKRPDELYKQYMIQYPEMIKKYNSVVRSVMAKEPDQITAIEPIAIDGIPEETVINYFAMMVLVLFGRVMKKLSAPSNMTKYDAIMLDSYFICYCKMGGDIYLMNSVWKLTKDFLKVLIERYPENTSKSKK